MLPKPLCPTQLSPRRLPPNPHPLPSPRLHLTPTPPYPFHPHPPPPSTALKVQVPLTATCLAPSTATPLLQLGYSVPSTGQLLSRSLELPLVVTKFCHAVDVPPAVFAQRWQQVPGPPLKLGERLAAAPPRPAAEALLASLGFALLPGADPDPAALCAAAVLHCGGAGGAPPRQVPCMVRLDGLGGAGAGLAVLTADAAASEALRARLAALLQ